MNPHRLVQPLTSAITVKCGDDGILSIVRACFDSLAWEQKRKEVGLNFFLLLIKRSAIIVAGTIFTVVCHPVTQCCKVLRICGVLFPIIF